jgi:two-component system, cell cycle response regulator DivK
MKPVALLVEDNENNRYLATLLLEHGGFRIIHAVNGREGLDAASREKPDIIILDIQMPEMDGYETAVRLKADAELAAIPIVGVSSYAMAGDREKAMKIGFAGYIEKPINPETFVGEIRRFLKTERGTS